MSIKKDENTKKTILFTVLAIILFLFGPFAVFLIVVAVIGCICYKFVAKNPHACVWDESHISLDKYLEK